MKKSVIGLLMVLTMFLQGCSSMQSRDPYTGETQVNNTTKGVGIGAVTGAVAGALLAGNPTKGAIIGGAVGALAGGGIGHYMDTQETELRQTLVGSGVQVSRQGDNVQLIMPGNITFETGSALINASFYSVLNSVAKVINKYDSTVVDITGHTDNTGTAQRNQVLSQERADSVMAYLSGQGVARYRIHAFGVGFSQPIASNATEQGRAQNRRVEILLRPTQ